MIPSALIDALRRGMEDFLRASFSSTTPGFAGALEALLDTRGGVMKGPWVEVMLPFQRGTRAGFFPRLPLAFTPFRHQEAAFERLGGPTRRSTLVATGTGSGKTECFLVPILAHCLDHLGEPGIKAILIYPMNALASDQALRIAKLVESNPALRGAVTAGLYVGEDADGPERVAHGTMGPDHVITDRDTLRRSPPDILLTNYKMLDFLLIRPQDRPLWAGTERGSLRFLVVDELHTFDGAQGTDLACLIRRVKDRVHAEPGQVCCVGTSATLGGDGTGAELREYATEVFGEPFGEDAVIGEVRQTLEAFRGDTMIRFLRTPGPGDARALDSTSAAEAGAWVAAQAALWFDHLPSGDPESDEWRVALGEQLREHVMLENLLRRLRGRPTQLGALASDLARGVPAFREDQDGGALGCRAILSFLALISWAREWMEELPVSTAAREAGERRRQAGPFLHVRVQLWQRELRRMVSTVAPEPRLAFSDDLQGDVTRAHLPVIHCRECTGMGWATVVESTAPTRYDVGLRRFYDAFFGSDPRVAYVFPAAAESWLARPQEASRRTLRHTSQGLFAIVPEAEEQVPIYGAGGPADTQEPSDQEQQRRDVPVVIVRPDPVDRGGRMVLSRDCPFCETPASLSVVGFQAATLTSVYVDQIFASPLNDDKKLLAFSDSVQDAALRAGFFGARTWSVNLRIAIQRLLEERDAPVTLGALAQELTTFWRGSGRMSPEQWLTTFLPRDMDWLKEWDEVRAQGEIPTGSPLPGLVERRLVWETCSEFGLDARIGRSLPRTLASVAGVHVGLLDVVVADLLPKLQNEVGGLRTLTAPAVRTFVAGLVRRLLERGGVLHDEIPREYLETLGDDTHSFSRRRVFMPRVGPSSRLPAFLTSRSGTRRFECPLAGSRVAERWPALWATRCLAPPGGLWSDTVALYQITLQSLTGARILRRHDTGKGAVVWGLDPAKLLVTQDVASAVCDRCGLRTGVPRWEAGAWSGAPCPSARCVGRAVVDAAPEPGYFARLYGSGSVDRVVSREHTGLLTRHQRETVEAEFKASDDRRPWFPNLLSCTPTLEMGIDIGDLSTAILCSVPPAQANYVQRVGRAGRRDGNAAIVAVANAQNHDNYFYAEPEEMIAGAVQPPGVYLEASAVLERQLTAYSFDRWVAAGAAPDVIAPKMVTTLAALHTGDTRRFPHAWRVWVEGRQAEVLDGFLALFGDRIQHETGEHLRRFLLSGHGEQGSMLWRVLDALHQERSTRESHRERRGRVVRRLTELRRLPVLDDATQGEIGDLEKERDALKGLIAEVNNRHTLSFLTDDGLLPNYAFPEAPVRLRSLIYRRRDAAGGQQGAYGQVERAYDTFTYTYGRPALAAITELAPLSTFYAGGRKVTVDQVDMTTSELEEWRFCDDCDHHERVLGAQCQPVCPACASERWPDQGRVHRLLRMRQVFANTSARKAAIGDEREERTPRYYSRQTLTTYRAEDRAGAWALGEQDVPFGWEFLQKLTLREVNFGDRLGGGPTSRIGGREEPREGFTVCADCGRVRTVVRGEVVVDHAFGCPARRRPAAEKLLEYTHLYREFPTEALRLLLPVADLGSGRQIASFKAALQVGLRERYRGKVDHVELLLTSEPVPGAPIRRQILVLYDQVPGGTGYLKELAKDPEHVHQVLTLARRRLATCGCAADSERDGCHRCVYRYRNRFEMGDVSRNEAVTILDRVLGAWESLREVEGIGAVSVSGLLGSVLEARFLEALRRSHREDRRSIVEKAVVAGKPGYTWHFGDRAWQMEPQVSVGQEAGLPLAASIDFVLRPDETDERPVAVFLDGWEFHRERVGLDMTQRMALLASGRYDVWSFTWDDVQGAIDGPAGQSPGQGGGIRGIDASRMGPYLQAAQGLGAPIPHHVVNRMSAPTFRWFLDTMEGALDRVAWTRLAFIALAAQLESLDQDRWDAAADALSPTALHPILSCRPEGIASVVEADHPGGVSVLTTGDRAEVLQALQRMAHQEPAGLTLLAVLHDRGELDGAVREGWASLLRLANFTRTLPGCWFVSERDRERAELGAILAMWGVREVADGPWADVLREVAPTFSELVLALMNAGAPVPEVGVDLPDARGRVAGPVAELGWPNSRVAVVAVGEQAACGDVDPTWRIFEGTDDMTVSELLAALRGEREAQR